MPTNGVANFGTQWSTIMYSQCATFLTPYISAFHSSVFSAVGTTFCHTYCTTKWVSHWATVLATILETFSTAKHPTLKAAIDSAFGLSHLPAYITAFSCTIQTAVKSTIAKSF